MLTSNNSIIKVMFDQQNDAYLDDGWLTDNERLTYFIKAREWILGKFKWAESPYVQGHQYTDEDLVVWERDTIRNARPHISESSTNMNHALVG